ncbi:MAG: flagellar hook-basal body protein [Tepidisphaeraceae bacterium]
MIYGLYLSAAGVVACSHRQDVIANNLANTETNAFKRDIPVFQQRLTEAQAQFGASGTSQVLENIGGGIFVSPSTTDMRQGELEGTGNNLDLAIFGDGYLAVRKGKEAHLTRDGRLAIDREGFLVLAADSTQRILDPQMKPIRIDSRLRPATTIGQHGEINQAGLTAGRIGLFNVPSPAALSKSGDDLLNYPDMKQLRPGTGVFQGGFVERSNVDPASELVDLMETQRQLEANANMIRYQDQTLGRLVNDLGKVT